MNYSHDMKRSIEYIEMHIKDNLTANEIAEYIGYSVYHFCRVFNLCNGIPLMDYVRSRKLSLARCELLKSKKIIDIAIDYGFQTASGFSKAFRKEFGYSPTLYIARMALWDPNNTTNIGGFLMNPVFMKKSAFKVAGYGIETNIESSYTKDIAAYWETYTGENLECKMYKQLNPPKHGEVGICIPSSNNGNVKYLLGVIVDDFSKVTSDMITVEVPEAEYMVFTTPPVDLTDESADDNLFSNIVKSTWKYIFEEWFPNSDYVFDEEKSDFEFYDERCHSRPDSTMDIFIPVKIKTIN